MQSNTSNQTETTTQVDAAFVIDADKLSPAQARYWNKLARDKASRVKLVDPFRSTLASLRERGFSGKVYRASTGGRWGKSAQIVTL